MIGTNGITGFLDANPYVEQTESEDTLGRDQFLTLFLSQIQNQDPLNPMDSTQFSAQLADFSSLEQLFNVNENLEELKNVQGGSNRFQAIDLIGKEIEAEGNMLYLNEDSLASGSFYLNASAECTVSIFDSNGGIIKQIPMGDLNPGQHSFEWTGINNSGETMDQDVYGFMVDAITESGQPLNVETQIKGVVDRVDLASDDPTVFIGDIYLSMSQVAGISLPAIEKVIE